MWLLCTAADALAPHVPLIGGMRSTAFFRPPVRLLADREDDFGQNPAVVCRAAAAPSLQRTGTEDEAADEEAFSTWLSECLADAPGADKYADLFADCHDCVLRWRRRYRGNQRLWRSLMKADRVVKEIVEAAPVLAAARDMVLAAPLDQRFTIVDLCSGKGFLSMILSELLPAQRVERCVLVDKAWPPFDWEGPIAEHHISDEHIYGARGDRGGPPGDDDSSYFSTWPIPLYTSKQDLKNRATTRKLGPRLFERCDGPVLVLAVHLCGTLALRAVDLFNAHPNVKLIALKPCCLPPMVFARRKERFAIGNHTFDAAEVCAPGRFRSGGVWDGPPRADLVPRFERWTEHLRRGVEATAVASGGRAMISFSRVQVRGGYQNLFIFAERGPQVTRSMWTRLMADAHTTTAASSCAEADG